MDIVNQMRKYPSDERFYLLEEINDHAGFFVVDGLPVYAVRSGGKREPGPPLQTALLEFDTGVELAPIREGKKDAALSFDLIRMTTIPDEREANVFFSLCRDHARGESGLSLRDFFFSASRLFRQKEPRGKRRAIGLFGELSVIERASSYGVDLSGYWQKAGVDSKYDFALEHFNIEVKTTTRREMIVRIRHAQLFNQDENVLAVCRVEKTPSGITVNKLAQKLKDSDECFNTLESRLLLMEELLAIEVGELSVPYKLSDITYYDCRAIDPFRSVPIRVTSLSYEYDLTGLPTIDFDDVLRC